MWNCGISVCKKNVKILKRFFTSTKNLNPPGGLADLTASPVLDAVPHRKLLRNNICLIAAATSTSAQFRYQKSVSNLKNRF
jgi:hypothetical protein